eukprot:scaffold294496_cov15-Tisochrysis_lutea.AAC.1
MHFSSQRARHSIGQALNWSALLPSQTRMLQQPNFLICGSHTCLPSGKHAMLSGSMWPHVDGAHKHFTCFEGAYTYKRMALVNILHASKELTPARRWSSHKDAARFEDYAPVRSLHLWTHHTDALKKPVPTREKMAPMATLTMDMREREDREPAKLIHLPSLAASSAAIKKVLSPISDRKMSEKAARKPLLPSGPFTSTSCACTRAC